MDLYRRADVAKDMLDSDEVIALQFARAADVRVASLEERLRGPAAAAKILAEEAALNRDQLGLIAVVTNVLQQAWNALPPSSQTQLRKDDTLLRCLLVGGGGCGKTRIINRVLRPLFAAFFGSDAAQTQAPSNKAARQIHGKTVHSANKRGIDASLRTVRLRLSPATRKALEHSTTPLGAMILDEFSQCNGHMLHADALRKTYGRQAAYALDLHRYAESMETWGRMPAVVIAGWVY